MTTLQTIWLVGALVRCVWILVAVALLDGRVETATKAMNLWLVRPWLFVPCLIIDSITWPLWPVTVLIALRTDIAAWWHDRRFRAQMKRFQEESDRLQKELDGLMASSGIHQWPCPHCGHVALIAVPLEPTDSIQCFGCARSFQASESFEEDPPCDG